MGTAYVHRKNWTPTKSALEIGIEKQIDGLKGHPQAVADKLNRKLLEQGIMPLNGVRAKIVVRSENV